MNTTKEVRKEPKYLYPRLDKSNDRKRNQMSDRAARILKEEMKKEDYVSVLFEFIPKVRR